MKSVLLYGCETCLVTNEIQRKIQTFVNRCLRYILRIWWPNIISNKDLLKVTGQEDINLEISKRKFRWIGHTLTPQCGVTSTARHSENITCRGVTSTARHAARSHSFVYISTT